MKVKHLIKKLSECNPENSVIIYEDDQGQYFDCEGYSFLVMGVYDNGHIYLESKFSADEEDEEVRVSHKEFVKIKPESILNEGVDGYDMMLTTRTANELKHHGIHTVSDLLKLSDSDILRFPNFGKKRLNEIKDALAKFNLTLMSKEHPE